MLILIWDFFTLFIFHLPFDIKDEPEGLTDGLLVVGDIEVGVACIGCLHEEVIEIELFIVGAEVSTAQSDEWEKVAIVKCSFGIGVHLKLYN